MISIFKDAQDQLHELILAAINKAKANGTLPDAEPADFVVEVPADTTKGDFATNAAMVNARALHMAPAKIAAAIIENFETEGTDVDRIEVAGPGFINIFMKTCWFSKILTEVNTKGDDFGKTDFGHGKKVQVEFVSANPTGPMHMGNARGGAIGDVLAEALTWAGYNAEREYYINDAGNQIEKFGLSLDVRYMQHYLGEDAVELPEDAYQGIDIKENAEEYIAEFGDKLVNVSTEERRKALVDYVLPRNIARLKRDLSNYRINYDVWFSESSLYPDGLNNILKILKDRNMSYEKDGAIWYRATAFGYDKDEVIIRQNGNPTYFAGDIAYHYNKFAIRGFEKVINVWGADHHGHVARMKCAMDAVGLDGKNLDIVLMQLVRLMKDGQPYRMSKRSGKAISLADLLEEVPIDAARFFFIMREPNSSLDFDLDLAVEESSNNPVYYIQYAHARIAALLKNMEAEGITPKDLPTEAFDALTAPEEKELIRKLGQFPQVIISTVKAEDPAKISTYLLEVATLFHKFYTSSRIKGEPDEVLYPRLALAVGAKHVIGNALKMLKITAPDKM